jgi:hypothetical protein
MTLIMIYQKNWVSPYNVATLYVQDKIANHLLTMHQSSMSQAA